LPYNAVYFTAHAAGTISIVGPIPFANVLVDRNSGLDHSTGEITIRTAGVYHFVSSVRQFCKNIAWISIVHNGKNVCSAYTNMNQGGELGCDESMISCASTIVANKNDNVHVKLHKGILDGATDPYCTFTGFLIATV